MQLSKKMIPAKRYSMDFFTTSCDRQVHTTLNCFVDGESRVLHTIRPFITEPGKALNFAYSEMEFPHVKKFYENVINYTGANEPPGYPQFNYSGANETPGFSEFEISKIIYKGYLSNQAIGLKDGKVYFIHYTPGQEENGVVPFILTLEEFKAIPIDMIERHIDSTAVAWTKLGESTHGVNARTAQKVTRGQKNSVDNGDTEEEEGIKYYEDDTGDIDAWQKDKKANGYDECDCDCMYKQQTVPAMEKDNTDKMNESDSIDTSFREAIK